MNREEALQDTLAKGTEAANLDLEEERAVGKTVAMPQLVKALEAIVVSRTPELGECRKEETTGFDKR